MYSNSRRTVLFPLLLAAGVVAGVCFGLYVGRHTAVPPLFRQPVVAFDNKLTQTLSLIENQYVDPVSTDSLAEHVVPPFLLYHSRMHPQDNDGSC